MILEIIYFNYELVADINKNIAIPQHSILCKLHFDMSFIPCVNYGFNC